MAAAFRAPEKLNQIESLAVNLLVTVEAVVRHHCHDSLCRLLRILYGAPYSTDQPIQILKRRQLRIPVPVVVSGMIKFGSVIVQILDIRVSKFLNQLTLELAQDYVTSA